MGTPAACDAGLARSLATENSLEGQLKENLASLALPLATVQSESPTARRISGKSFQVESNPAGVQSVRFDFHRDACTFTLTDARGAYPIRCGLEKWVDGTSDMPGTPPKITVGELRPLKVSASGTWKDADTFAMTWRFYETPHHDTVTKRISMATLSR